MLYSFLKDEEKPLRQQKYGRQKDTENTTKESREKRFKENKNF